MNSDAFKKLVEEQGIEKAMEIVRTTDQPLMEDFSKEHKKMNAFSNKTTDSIMKEIEKEEEIESVSSDSEGYVPFESSFTLQTTQTTEYAKRTLYAE